MEKPKKTKRVDIVSRQATKMANNLAKFYDKSLMDMLTKDSIFSEWTKIKGYRKVRVPRYLEITIPWIKRYFDHDDTYIHSDEDGWLLFTKKIRICQIGTKTEKRPIYFKPKSKGSVIKFKKYGSLIASLKPIGKTGKKYKVVKVTSK